MARRVEAGTHHLVADELTNVSGGDAGPTPFGFVLCGLAACTAMTLRLFDHLTGYEGSTPVHIGNKAVTQL